MIIKRSAVEQAQSTPAARLKARARFVRLLPPREQPLHGRDFPTIRGYPDGYDIADLGTLPRPSKG